MSVKMDDLRSQLKPGDGVMIRLKAEPEEWDWGTIVTVTSSGFFVEIWEPTKKYQRMCNKEDVFPDNATWEDYDEALYAPAATVAKAHSIIPASNSNVVSINDNKSQTKAKAEQPAKKWDDLPDDECYVFVYGTLKKGGRLNKYLANAQFIGKDQTAFKKYNMFSCSEMFPAVTDMKGTCSIEGEIYKLTPKEVLILDDVEGVPFLYHREKCWCKTFEKQCYIYIASLRTSDAYGLERGDKIKFNAVNDSLSWKN